MTKIKLTGDMRKGFMLLWVKLKEHPKYNDPEFMMVWIHLILSASRTGKKGVNFCGKTIDIKKGQTLPISRKSISSETGVSESKVQRVLKRLENEHRIEQLIGNRSRVITLTNWGQYQDIEHLTEQLSNNKRTTDEQPPNTIESIKESNIEPKKVKSSAKSVDLPPDFNEMIGDFRSHFMIKFTGYRTRLESEQEAVELLLKRNHTNIDEYYEILKLLQSDPFWSDKCRSLGKLLKLTRDKTQYEFDRLLGKARESKPTNYSSNSIKNDGAYPKMTVEIDPNREML